MKARGAKRPRNIVITIMIRPVIDNCGVMPVVNPTVPIAEKVSNKIVLNENFSVMDNVSTTTPAILR